MTEGRPGSSYFAILRARLPEHRLVNLGQGNDTVISLSRRLARQRFGEPFDLAFLWIGVNDVTAGTPWTFRAISLILRKAPARTPAEFRAGYQATLDLVRRHARQVVAVAPLLKGEDMASPANHEVQTMARVVEDMASHAAHVEYLDLRAAFVQRLAGRLISNYLPRSVVRVALDALTLRSNAQVDRAAARRGLHLTLDGIHLNSVGAEIVADEFWQVIRRLAHKEHTA